MVRIKLSTLAMDVDITFQEKVVFVRGFSGTGKSLFVSELQQVLEKNIGILETNAKITVVNNSAIVEYIREVESDKPTVYVCDENYAEEVLAKVKGLNVYAVIVSRKKHADWNYSYKSVYQASRENGKTIIKTVYSFSKSKYKEV